MAIDRQTQVTAINQRLKEFGKPLGITATQTTEASGAIKFSVTLNTENLFSNFLKN